MRVMAIAFKQFMSGISIEEIRRAEGNLLTNGSVDFKDEAGVKTLFLWEYTHCKLLHEFLSIDDYDQLGRYKASYAPKRFCVQKILACDIWWNYGRFILIHILKDHLYACFREFKELLVYDSEYRREGLRFNDEYDLLRIPTYIVEKSGDIINIYRTR